MSIQENLELLRKDAHAFMDRNPDLKDAFMDHYRASYAPGALEPKTKHLIALCGGLIAGCDGCILGQTEMAMDKGASVEEVIETCQVAMSLGGTLAWSQIAKVAAWLRENGHM